MTGPDTAVGEVYIDLHLVVPDLAAFNPAESNKGVPGRLWFAGRYADEYAKGNDGKWRFLRRTMIQDWSRMVPHKRGLAASQAGRFTPGSFSDPASDPSVGFLPTADIRAPEMADLPRLAAVQDALHTYTRGIDRRDPSLITAAYHPGAYDDHGPYKGTAEGFVKWADAGLEAIEGCHHGITGSVVVLDGEKKARAETRVVERAWYGKDGNESVRWFVGRYLDVLEEREQGWKIASRVVVLDWSVIDPVVAKPTEKWKAMFEVGTRDATDLAARTLAKLDEGGPAKL
ncbi:hypothetical protein DFJ74DRAFT_666540 [Hyaloraphidium curvatum]|nr:hypothetical protein DFJ74DRAFT_666540 [Hyaloraphidium curvatum]